jgi:hypothetical protein
MSLARSSSDKMSHGTGRFNNNKGDDLMGKSIKVHEGVIRPNLVAELEAFRPPEGDGRVSSYYLNLDPHPLATPNPPAPP